MPFPWPTRLNVVAVQLGHLHCLTQSVDGKGVAVEVLGKVYSPASAPPRPNTAVVRGHASMRHQPCCLVPLSDALGLSSVAMVRIEAVEVRDHRR